MVTKEIRNDFEQSLIDAGYKIYKDNLRQAIRLFQKAYRDELGVKYFLNVYHYNHGEQLPHTSAPNQDSYQFDAQFNLADNGKDNTIDVQFMGDFTENEWRDKTTLLDAELFYERLFTSTGCKYYELRSHHNQLELFND